MLFSVEQAFVGRDEKRAPLKTPAWEARWKEAGGIGSRRGIGCKGGKGGTFPCPPTMFISK